ncbi:MAG: J domain-containing protein [Candidatus Competibacter sp.]
MSTMTDPPLSAATLLAIPPTEPERLFSGNPETARQEFRALVSIWHPDRCPRPEATAVFQHLNRLYDAALEKLSAGIWQTPGLLWLRATDGTEFRVRYHREREFELGWLFVGDGIMATLVDQAHSDLFQNALAAIGRLPCADARMAAEIGRYVPEIIRCIEIGAGSVLVARKTSDLLLLRDVLDHYNGRLDARHVAWIFSSLLNLACYLDYAGMVHNAISADTYYISPPAHGGALLGGWWYAVRQGEPLHAAPALTVQYAPFDVMTHRRGDHRTDLELIRVLSRELTAGRYHRAAAGARKGRSPADDRLAAAADRYLRPR